MDAILEPGGVWVFSEVWARVDGSTSSLSLLKCFCPPSPTGEIPSHLREFAEAAASLILAFDEDVPGRAMSSGNAEWLSNLEHAPLETFKRPVQARTAGLKTAFGVPIQYDGPNFSNCCMVLCVYSDQTLQYDDQLLENLLRIFKERRELAALRDLSNSYPAPKDLLPPTHSQFLSLPLMSSFSDMDVLHGMDLPNLVWPNSSTPSIASPASHPTTTNHSPYRLSPVASDSLSFTTTTTSPIGPSLNLKLELDDILVDPTTSNSNSNSKAGDPFLKAIYDLTFKHDLMMTPLAPQQLQHSQQQQQHQQQQQQQPLLPYTTSSIQFASSASGISVPGYTLPYQQPTPIVNVDQSTTQLFFPMQTLSQYPLMQFPQLFSQPYLQQQPLVHHSLPQQLSPPVPQQQQQQQQQQNPTPQPSPIQQTPTLPPQTPTLPPQTLTLPPAPTNPLMVLAFDPTTQSIIPVMLNSGPTSVAAPTVTGQLPYVFHQSGTTAGGGGGQVNNNMLMFPTTMMHQQPIMAPGHTQPSFILSSDSSYTQSQQTALRDMTGVVVGSQSEMMQNPTPYTTGETVLEDTAFLSEFLLP